jgi:hypothetical protein
MWLIVAFYNFTKVPKNVQHEKCRLVTGIITAFPIFSQKEKKIWWTFENGDHKERRRRNVMFRNLGTIASKELCYLSTKLHSVTCQEKHLRESFLSKYLPFLRLNSLRPIKLKENFVSGETLLNQNKKFAILIIWPFEAWRSYEPNIA